MLAQIVRDDVSETTALIAPSGGASFETDGSVAVTVDDDEDPAERRSFSRKSFLSLPRLSSLGGLMQDKLQEKTGQGEEVSAK